MVQLADVRVGVDEVRVGGARVRRPKERLRSKERRLLSIPWTHLWEEEEGEEAAGRWVVV